MSARKFRQLVLQGSLLAVLGFVWAAPVSAIPAFARKYSLRCTACHESWPVLNDFGNAFRDNGYQLRLGKDDTITANSGYWPVAVHVTPHYEYDSLSNQTTDQGRKTLHSGGIADASMDLLMAGTLTKDVSFLVVPTGFASDGSVSLESYWAYFSRVIGNSDWLNIRVGKFELDLPASPHRGISLAVPYLVYGFHPGASPNPFNLAKNQRGVEFVGHDLGSMRRYGVAVFSANDSQGSQHALNSPSVYGHFQQFFQFDSASVSKAEVGVFAANASYPTTFLTTGGTPIPGSGGNLKSSRRYGLEGQVWLGSTVAPLHLNLVYARGSDDVALMAGADRSGTWNGGFLEAIWVPAKDLLHWSVFGRYDWIRNKQQPLAAAPTNLNDQDQMTVGVRYTIAYSNRDEVGFHVEYATNRTKGIADDGSDVRANTVFLGVDFLY
jgi:hypothetical protein